MEKKDIEDSDPIVQRLLTNLLSCIRDRGQLGVIAKSTIGWAMANSQNLLKYDKLGYPLDACFDQVRQAGATLIGMERVRVHLDAEQPRTLGGTLVRDRSIQLALAQEGLIIGAMTFESREDVDKMITAIKDPFDKAEEIAADTMSGADYMAISSLRAAIVNHLVSTARPLPMMLIYQFSNSLPSLIISHRLYGDASRYDEIRKENKVVHPAFCKSRGYALSR